MQFSQHQTMEWSLHFLGAAAQDDIVAVEG
jgi:hypothetical protein